MSQSRKESSTSTEGNTHALQDDTGAQGAGAQRLPLGEASPGTESSNTVPDKDNPQGNIIIQPFRWGVDSLYLSFNLKKAVGLSI